MNPIRDATRRVGMATEPCPNCREPRVPQHTCTKCGYRVGNATPAAVAAEATVFQLQRKIDRYLAAGDVEEVNHLQLRIAELQQKYGATHGTRKGQDNDPTT